MIPVASHCPALLWLVEMYWMLCSQPWQLPVLRYLLLQREGRYSICMISTVGLAHDRLPQTVVNTLRNARAPSTRFLFDSQWRLLACLRWPHPFSVFCSKQYCHFPRTDRGKPFPTICLAAIASWQIGFGDKQWANTLWCVGLSGTTDAYVGLSSGSEGTWEPLIWAIAGGESQTPVA